MEFHRSNIKGYNKKGLGKPYQIFNFDKNKFLQISDLL